MRKFEAQNRPSCEKKAPREIEAGRWFGVNTRRDSNIDLRCWPAYAEAKRKRINSCGHVIMYFYYGVTDSA